MAKTVIRRIRHTSRSSGDSRRRRANAKVVARDRLSPRAIVRNTVLGAGSVLAAFTLRDFMQALFSSVVNYRTSLLIMGIYTVFIFVIVIWVAYIWE